MKNFPVARLCIVSLLLLEFVSAIPGAAASSARADGEVQWQKLRQEAAKEGKLMIYSTTAGDALREIFSPFQTKFGIKVDYIIGRGEELASRMTTERSASLYIPDVIMSGGSTLLLTMKPTGLIDPFAGTLIHPEVLDNKAWVGGKPPYMDKGPYAIGMLAVLQRYIVRNSNLVREEELKSYKDLLLPKWRGQIVINDPTLTGAGSALFTHLAYDVWGVEKTLDFMRQLVKQEPVITRNTALQVEWLARGKYAIAVAPMQEQVAKFLKAGAPLAHFRAEEGGKIASGVGCFGLANRRPHPNAAALYANWLLTKEGMAQVVKAYKYPGTRVDSPTTGVPAEFFPYPGEKLFWENEESILLKDDIIKLAKEIFAPLIK